MYQKFLKIIFLLFLSAASANANQANRALLVIKTRDNQIFDLNKIRGKITIISFFTSWCKPCLSELAELEEIYLTQKNIEIIAINLDHIDEEKNLKFTKKFSYKFAKLSDASVNNLPEPESIPTVYFIGCDGVITNVDEGDFSIKKTLREIKCNYVK